MIFHRECIDGDFGKRRLHSYRRQGGSDLAQLVYKDLKRRGFRVFMDVRELRSGHFDDELRRQVGGAKDFVLLLTPDSLERCQNSDDWLRHEIALALRTVRGCWCS